MPIICGGTNYYIESLVWKVLVDQGGSSIDSGHFSGQFWGHFLGH